MIIYINKNKQNIIFKRYYMLKILLLVFLSSIMCLDNGRGLTPIMGWRPYDH